MNQEQIGKFIKKLRQDNNLTQKELADYLKVTYQAVSKWENGKSLPDISVLKIISDKFNVNIDEILNGEKVIKKRMSKRVFLIVFVVMVLIFLIVTLILKNHNDFEFKTISTSCKEFNITGSAAYNKDKSSIYISNINYCGREDSVVYKDIDCFLYEEFEDTITKVAVCSNKKKQLRLSDYLEEVKIKVDNYSASCKKFKSSKLFLQINATDNNDKVTTYKIPINLEDNCLSNK